MKPTLILASLAVFALFTLSHSTSQSGPSKDEMPFGGEKDVKFAGKLWKAMEGYRGWPMKSGFYPGGSPHGQFLRMYYNVVIVDGRPYHVVVKDNYGGEDATLMKVSKAPEKYLMAVTVMLQREAGYDPDNMDWFWVKYQPDGTVDKNPKGMALAGRVAKGMDAGCIACHANAMDDDYLFVNDE